MLKFDRILICYIHRHAQYNKVHSDEDSVLSKSVWIRNNSNFRDKT